MKHGITSLLILLCLGFQAFSQNHSIGSTTVNFIDPERNNRSISTAIYYPALSSGQNASIAPGQFPVIAFGHGFVMVHTAYNFLWTELVPKGYILAFPTTEGSFSPSHLNFGLDLAFIVNQMKVEGQDASSFFYNAVAETSAVMGHSMGGGASFLACDGNQEPTTIVTFAAANTNPSAIGAAEGVTIPTLLFAGQNDCVTPPPVHQYPIYEATASQQKIIVDIIGGGHCFFADYNLFCAIGEGSCSPQPTISRSEQHAATLDFLNPWFEFMLKNNPDAWQVFLDSLQSSARITYQMDWNMALPPTGLVAHNITSSGADLSWTAGGTENQWDILWGENSFDPNTEGTLIEGIMQNSYQLDGLEPATAYDFYVRSNLGDGFFSTWAGPESFATLAGILPGDANCDETVNVLDVVTIVNYIMGANPDPFCFENADVNQDDVIDVLDVVATANIIL
jgi:hypothetical protein